MLAELRAELEAAERRPGGGAWKRISELMREAKSDPAIKHNEGAVDFLSMMETLTKYAFSHWDAKMTLKPIIDHGDERGASLRSRNAAQSKNAEPRAWVLSEWDGRTNKDEKKAEFARQYSQKVRLKFNLIVNPETISREWLPKTKK